MKKKYRLKEHVKKKLMIGLIIVMISLFIILTNIINSDMQKHIEKVSQECALKGHGITLQYTTEGDKFYVCKEK